MKKIFISDLIEDGIEFHDDAEDEEVILVRNVPYIERIIEDVSVKDWYIVGTDLYIRL